MIALSATIVMEPATHEFFSRERFTITDVIRATAQSEASYLPSPRGPPKTQDFHVRDSPGGIHPPAHSDLPGVQVSATAKLLTCAASQLNETLFQGWTANIPSAGNAASMDAREHTTERAPEYFPADTPRTNPGLEQIAPPEPVWRRQEKRKSNGLTQAQKKNIYRKMPQGWEPLADAEIWALTPEKLHNITGAHITTCRRWLKHPPPELVVRLVCILIGGDLGAINKQWRGWTVRKDGQLVSPEQWVFTTGRVLASALGWDGNRCAVSAAQQRERDAVEALDRLKQADFIEQRWVEPDEHKLTEEKAEQRLTDAKRTLQRLQEDHAMGRIADDEKTEQQLRNLQHELQRLQKEHREIQTFAAMAARVQERPGADDAEQERRQRFYYWRERGRRNETAAAYSRGPKR